MRSNSQDRYLIPVAAVMGFMAVALGAFGAHALRDRLSMEMLSIWHTGVEYHFGHALATILAGSVYAQMGSKAIRTAGWLFVIGSLIFSGSLYFLALTGERVLGAITPLGGLCYLAGWILFAVGAARGGGTEPS